MSEPRNDDEQLQVLKDWWQENGAKLLAILVLGLGGYLGWNFWQDHRDSQINAAADLYNQLGGALDQAASGDVATQEELKTVRFLADQLQSDHANSKYSLLGALGAAEQAVVSDNLDEAGERLQWALDNADTDTDRQLIRYRLAKVHHARGESDAALELLSEASDSFAMIYAELRGDIHQQNGRNDQALEAYRSAMDAMLADQQHYQSSLQMKIDYVENGLGTL